MNPIEKIAQRRSELKTQRDTIDHKLSELEIAERVIRELGADVVQSEGETPTFGNVERTESIQARRIKRKTVIRDVLKAAWPEGLQSAEIRDCAKERYGIELNPNTVTVTLGRYKHKGMARIDGRTWFHIPPEKGLSPEDTGETEQAGAPPAAASEASSDSKGTA